MGIRHTYFSRKMAPICELNLGSPTKRLFSRVKAVIAPGPLGGFLCANFPPESCKLRVMYQCRRVAIYVVPETCVERGSEDIHDTVVKRFAGGARIEFLRVPGA